MSAVFSNWLLSDKKKKKTEGREKEAGGGKDGYIPVRHRIHIGIHIFHISRCHSHLPFPLPFIDILIPPLELSSFALRSLSREECGRVLWFSSESAWPVF